MNPIYASLAGLAIIGLMVSVMIRLIGNGSFWFKLVSYLGTFAIFALGLWMWTYFQLPVDWPQLLYASFQWWYPFAVILPGVILLAIADWVVSTLKNRPQADE